MSTHRNTALITATRSPHLTVRPAGGMLAFDPVPDPGLAGALCVGEDPEVFFPLVGDRATAKKAREICARCPVAEACLAEALREEGGRSHSTRFGIRGGKSPNQRHRLYRQRKAAEEARVQSPPVADPPQPKRRVAKCGTRSGYLRHRRNDEVACDACRAANSAAGRRLYRTGSTRAVA
ncbi:WhiB family transcriptional regulator [Streptomyces sp. NPDC001667]